MLPAPLQTAALAYIQTMMHGPAWNPSWPFTTPNITIFGSALSQRLSISAINSWILFGTRYVTLHRPHGIRSSSQFGEGVALYFAFLASYTHTLLFIALIGLVAHYFGHAYSITYSSLLFLWSVVFVEYWRIRERLYAVSWGCLGSVRVENHRPNYTEGHLWWKRELKILLSVPVIALFASLLALLLTAIFIFEAFVTTLYTGPGHKYVVRQTFFTYPISHLAVVSLLSRQSLSPRSSPASSQFIRHVHTD